MKISKFWEFVQKFAQFPKNCKKNSYVPPKIKFFRESSNKKLSVFLFFPLLLFFKDVAIFNALQRSILNCFSTTSANRNSSIKPEKNGKERRRIHQTRGGRTKFFIKASFFISLAPPYTTKRRFLTWEKNKRSASRYVRL